MADAFGLSQREKDTAPPSASPFPRENSTASERSRRLNIIVVEDNPEDVLLVKEALNFHNITADLVCHRDGEVMLRYIDRIDAGAAPCPDVVLLDLNLPRHNGKAILARMRNSPVCGHVPVIIVSSSKDEGDRADTKRLGATRYFHKSIDFDETMSLGSVILEVTRRTDTI